MRTKAILIAGLVLPAAVFLLNACGGGAKGIPAPDSLAPPMAELRARLDAEFARLGIDPAKVSATAPEGDTNAVFDLAGVIVDPDGDGGNPPTGIDLSFTERAIGDYDQNGEVNVGDLTPLGQRFHQLVDYDAPADHGGIDYWPTGLPTDDGGVNPPADGSGAQNWRKARIDGDNNGELNIADITPIATHFQQKLNGYRIYRKGPGDTDFIRIPNPSAVSSPFTIGRPTIDPSRPVCYAFSDTDSTAPGIYEFYVAPYETTGSDEGLPSNHITIEILDVTPPANLPPVAALTVNPGSGQAPLTVDLDASTSTDSDGTIALYSWDWEGDGTYDFDSAADATVQHIYAPLADTIYHPKVKVTDDDGAIDTATQNVNVNMGPTNQSPLPSFTVTPTEGAPPLTVDFDAAASYDPDGTIVTYIWDFEDDGTPDQSGPAVITLQHTYYAAGPHTCRLTVWDDGGASNSTTRVITVFGNVGPVADLQADVTTGSAPLTVNFDAGASSDPDGSIVDYEWDLNGNGVFNESSNLEAARHGSPTVQQTYLDPGIYTVIVRVTDNDAATDTDSVAVNVAIHGWWFVAVNTPGDDGKYSSFAIVNGMPAIAFSRWNNGLFYIRANDVDGLTWGDPVRLDTFFNAGKWTSMQVVNGVPLVSYFTDNDGMSPPSLTNLSIVRALDADGATWDAPVILENDLGNFGGYTSMQIIGGNPAFSYYNDNPGALKYIRATDASGSTWGAPQTVASGEDYQYTRMQIINGNPAIAFCAATMTKFVRASDALGASWGSPVTVDGNVNNGYELSLGIINGNPAVTYKWATKDSSDQRMYYTRASNADGTAWGSPLQLENVGITGTGSSLVSIGGTPMVTFVDQTGGALKLRRATDANGATWDPAEIIKPGIGDGGFTHLTMVNGHLAVIFYKGDTKDLYYGIYFE